MTLLVRMHNGDAEHFPSATHWATIPDGGLRLFIAAETPVLIAEFPPGAWAAVFDPAPQKPVVVDGEGLGKTYRRTSGFTVTSPLTYSGEPPASAGVPA